MNIYTGNFANVKKYKEAGLMCISIARFNKYFRGSVLVDLAPPPAMIHLPEETYTPKFKREVIGKLDPKAIWNKIHSVSYGQDVILLCYEKAGDFCHRRLVADWLEERLGIKVEEYPTGNKPKKCVCDIKATAPMF